MDATLRQRLEDGLKTLKTLTEPSQELASYFFAISEDSSAPNIIRDWALDASLLAGEGFDAPVPRSLDTLERDLVRIVSA